MHSNRRAPKHAFLAALVLSACIVPAFGQDARVNPFLPQSTTEEQRIIAEKERMRQAIREMMPEIKSMLMPSLEEQKTEILAQTVEQVMTQVKEDPAFAMAAAGAVPAGAAADPAAAQTDPGGIPLDAKFIGCINGKALYRDTIGIRYFDESPEAADRCPR